MRCTPVAVFRVDWDELDACPADEVIQVAQSFGAVSRLDDDGDLDERGDGHQASVITPLGSNESLRGLALQADGRIVAAGTSAGDFAVARYNPDGSLDTTFGSAGIVITDFGGTGDSATSVAIQGDGRIVAMGETLTGGDVADFALARYNGDGSLDATFGSGGVVTTDFASSVDRAASMALQADGKIVAVGTFFISGSPTHNDFAVARCNTDGSLDSTFGVGGLVTTDIATSSDATSSDTMGGVAIQADGGIVVAGTTNRTDFALVRYEGSASHTVTFFLHGHDVPGTAGAFTMNLTAPAPQRLVSRSGSVSWFSDPVVNGTFLAGSTFQLTMPCRFGVGFPKIVRLASTDAAGGGEQPLGEIAVGLQFCQSQTIDVPATTPVGLAQRRLKLTLVSPLPVSPPLPLGEQTFLRVTDFAGTP